MLPGFWSESWKVPHATCVQPGSGVKLLPPSSLTEIVMRALPDGLGPSFGKLIDLTVMSSSCGRMTYPLNFDLLWQASHRQPPLMQPPKIFHVYPSLSVTDTSFCSMAELLSGSPHNALLEKSATIVTGSDTVGRKVVGSPSTRAPPLRQAQATQV